MDPCLIRLAGGGRVGRPDRWILIVEPELGVKLAGQKSVKVHVHFGFVKLSAVPAFQRAKKTL